MIRSLVVSMSCQPPSSRPKNKARGLHKILTGNIGLRSLTVVRVAGLLKKARFLFFHVNIGFKFNLVRVLNLHLVWNFVTSTGYTLLRGVLLAFPSRLKRMKVYGVL